MAYFTFTLNGHEYTSDPANVTAADGYRFIGYGYIPALGNLAIDLVALATGVGSNATAVDEATEIAVEAAGEADEARDAAVAAAAAATSAAQGLQGTSATALTPGVGNRVFVTQAGKQFPLNHNIVAVSASDPNVFIYGTVGAYAGTGLTINCTVPGTATEKADWVIAVSGVRGLQGIQGPQGEDAEFRSLVQPRGANGTITVDDLGHTLRCTAAITLTPDSPASLGDGFSTLVDAPSHVVTIDGVGTVPVGAMAVVQSDGSDITLRLLGSQAKMLHVRDEKSTSTSGGAGATGSDQTRPLNTVVLNEITGASLASNQVTVPAGVYEVEGYVPAESVGGFRAMLHNVTAGTTVQGLNVTANGSYQGWGMSMVRAKVTLAAPAVFELRMRQIVAPGGSQEWGSAIGVSGVIEVYSTLIFRKVG